MPAVSAALPNPFLPMLIMATHKTHCDAKQFLTGDGIAGHKEMGNNGNEKWSRTYHHGAERTGDKTQSFVEQCVLQKGLNESQKD